MRKLNVVDKEVPLLTGVLQRGQVKFLHLHELECVAGDVDLMRAVK